MFVIIAAEYVLDWQNMLWYWNTVKTHLNHAREMLDGDERTGIQADNCSKDILTLTILVKESDLKAYSMRGCFLCNCLTMELLTVPGSYYYFNPKLFETFIIYSIQGWGW